MRKLLVVLVLVAVLVLPTSGAAGSAGSERLPQLVAWAAVFHAPVVGISRVGYQGPVLKRLPPGSYRVQVETVADLSFHLRGPNVDRRTGFGAEYGHTYFRTWILRFRKGVYRYEAEGVYALQLARGGSRIRGSFVVR